MTLVCMMHNNNQLKVEGANSNSLPKSVSRARLLIPYPQAYLKLSECLQCKVGANLGEKRCGFGRMHGWFLVKDVLFNFLMFLPFPSQFAKPIRILLIELDSEK